MGRKKKPLPLLKGIEISGLAAEGKSIAKVKLKEEDEKPLAIFIPYGAPGDIVDIQLDKKKHSFAEAHITDFIQESPIRCKPKCAHFGICGGCKWQHLPYDEQLNQKYQQVKDVLTRIGKIELPEIQPVIGSEHIWGYRNKMEYTFSNKKWRTWEDIKSGKEFTDSPNALGFHIPGAFDKVLHIDTCYLQEEMGNRIRNFIYNYAEENNLTFYNIRDNSGQLRTLMIRISSAGEIIVIVVFGEVFQERDALLNAITDKFPEVTSLGYVVNLKLNDSIADQDVIMVRGPEYITEEMEGLKFRVNAKSFYQTNSRQAYKLYCVAREFAGLSPNTPDEKKPLVYDLYTGTGTIANFVAKGASKVIGIEYVEEAIADAKLNADVNGLRNTEFYAGDMKDILTDEFISQHGHPDVMIIDPPRAGMHEDVIKVILNASPERIVYVSCNPATQARDLALLDEMYKVVKVQPVDMFPHTHHVENVCLLIHRS